MSNPAQHHKITYIEFASTDIERTKQFYAKVFGWSFQDWGPEYISFAGAGISGGFAKGEAHEEPGKFAPLIVLYSADLKETEAAIVAGGDSTSPMEWAMCWQCGRSSCPSSMECSNGLWYPTFSP
jgi:predicted enzyme related to lactoylglutathione lyase